MLILIFQLGADRYAMDCQSVVEIVPQVSLKEVPHAPKYVAGLFNYRGTIVPVIDLRELIQRIPCQPHLSSRIVLVDYSRITGATNGPREILGLIAERVSEVREKPKSSTRPIVVDDANFMGEIVLFDGDMIQLVEPGKLLTESLRRMLFAGSAVDVK